VKERGEKEVGFEKRKENLAVSEKHKSLCFPELGEGRQVALSGISLGSLTN
jgi:hypothetical protein